MKIFNWMKKIISYNYFSRLEWNIFLYSDKNFEVQMRPQNK